MTRRDIADRVAENAQRTRKINSTFVEVTEDGGISLSFTSNILTVGLSVVVYKRSLNNGLVSGHPDSKHGSGRGVSGDRRGEWTLAESDTATAVITRTGRRASRDILAGTDAEITEVAAGADGTDAEASDDSLLDPDGRGYAWQVIGSGTEGEVEVAGSFRFSAVAEEGQSSEWGVYTRDGRLLGRATTDAVTIADDEEARLNAILTVSGSGVGSTVVTADGEEAIAQALVSGSAYALDSLGFGTGTDEFDKSDSGLTSPVIRKDGILSIKLNSARLEANLGGTEPANQPVTLSEVGAFDAGGTLLWATTFFPTEKESGEGATASVGFTFSSA